MSDVFLADGDGLGKRVMSWHDTGGHIQEINENTKKTVRDQTAGGSWKN